MSLHSPWADARTVETPAATMRTLASPSTSPAMDLAVWHTELPADVPGPEHRIDVDQFLVVTRGALVVRVDDRSYSLGTGDGVKLPAGATRVIRAADGRPASTITIGPAGAHATVGTNEPVAVPWTA